MVRLALLGAVLLGACLMLTTTGHAEPNVRIASFLGYPVGDGRLHAGQSITASHCSALGLESKEGSSCADG